MIKILHIITDLNTGGAEMMLYKLLSFIDRSRFNNVVVSMGDTGTLGGRIKTLGIPVYVLNMRRGIPNPLGLWRLLQILRKERPQVLQTWLYHADLLGLLTGRLLRVPSIVWNIRCAELKRGDINWVLNLTLKLLSKLSHKPKAVIINSLAGRHVHERLGYRPVKWEIIPNGFDINLFSSSEHARVKLRKSLGLLEHAPLIGMVARFNPIKDFTNFLNAAGELYKFNPNVHYVLVGQGVTKENKLLFELITALGIEDNVHLLGERDDIPLIMGALDVYTSSSYSEGFPNTIGEAMACGVPCVVTDAGDSAYLVGESGLVVPSRNSSALNEAWVKILSMSENKRIALGMAARERVVSLFSIDSVVKKYEKLYIEICIIKNRF